MKRFTTLHQMGFEPMRLSPEDLKSSLLDLAPALIHILLLFSYYQ